MSEAKTYRTFNEFYPFYLSEHTDPISRRLHFAGTSIVVVLIIAAVIMQTTWLAVIAFFQAYAFAWIGHFFFAHNRPATFKYPVFSFIGDWCMWWQILTGKIKF